MQPEKNNPTFITNSTVVREVAWGLQANNSIFKQLSPKPLSRAVDGLRQLRNRVFHHEPIWHWTGLSQRHTDAVQLLGWLNPEAARMVKHTDRFNLIYQQGPSTFIQELYQ